MNSAVIVYILSKKSIDLKKSQKQSSPATINKNVISVVLMKPMKLVVC